MVLNPERPSARRYKKFLRHFLVTQSDWFTESHDGDEVDVSDSADRAASEHRQHKHRLKYATRKIGMFIPSGVMMSSYDKIYLQ